jgi:hypothetical protein
VPVSESVPPGLHYRRTVIVGKGTPTASFDSAGRYNDEPSLKVDDWSRQSPFAGNVYIAWTLFTGGFTKQDAHCPLCGEHTR